MSEKAALAYSKQVQLNRYQPTPLTFREAPDCEKISAEELQALGRLIIHRGAEIRKYRICNWEDGSRRNDGLHNTRCLRCW